MSDPYHEWADRELLDEHTHHPERFARYVVKPEKTMNTKLLSITKRILSAWVAGREAERPKLTDEFLDLMLDSPPTPTDVDRYKTDAEGWKAEAERWRELAESAMAELAKAREAIQLLADTARELNDIVNPA
jgi:hypothetical protein